VTLEGKLHVNEHKVEVTDFVLKGDPAELLSLMRETGLRNHPLVRSYDNASAPAFFQKEADLRRLAYGNLKRHSDFCTRVVRLLMDRQVKKK
jgi:hypothetical protein